MNTRLFFLVGIISLCLSGCWIDEAKESTQKSLFIVADYLSKEDSLVINQFAFNYHVKVKQTVLSPEAILQRIRTNRYNAEIDILIIEDPELRKKLQEINVFRSIRNERLFSQLERQFNNQHHQWIPISHDPLIVVRGKDSINTCPTIDFKMWHKKDSLRPKLSIKQHEKHYANLLENSAHLNWMMGKTTAFGDEQIYRLSEYVSAEFSEDSIRITTNSHCRYFLIDNKRTISLINTVSIYKHGRNIPVAENFLTFFLSNSYSIANGRSQLPTKKGVSPNWYIRSLSIQ